MVIKSKELIFSFLSSQPDTSLHCKTTDTVLVHHAVWLFIPELSLLLTTSTHGGMARLSWSGRLRWFTRLPTVTHPSANWAQRRL